jgi:hypothetical protein
MDTLSSVDPRLLPILEFLPKLDITPDGLPTLRADLAAFLAPGGASLRCGHHARGCARPGRAPLTTM